MTIHLCSFSEGLDDLKRWEQRSIETVLRFLSTRNRFSVFEATANTVIARTMTDIEAGQYIKRTGGSYPWIEYELTDKARSLIAESPQTEAAQKRKREAIWAM